MEKYLIAFCLLFAFDGLAQAPQGFSFQGIANDVAGKPIIDKDIKVEIKLLQGSGTGTILYKEVHQAHTNTNGLYSLSVGMGVPSLNLFSDIEWKNSPIFISVGLDSNNGNNFVLAGITQLLSVPYALFAEKSNINNCHSHVIISGNISEQEVLQKLKEQVGECTEFIWILNTSKITTLDLKGLNHLIELRIENNALLKEVLLPDLKNVELDISILNNPKLSNLNFSDLKSVGGSLTLINCGVNFLEFPLLESVDANLSVSENNQLTSFLVPKLLETSSILILNNQIIPKVDFPELLRVNNEFQITTNKLMNSCFLNKLKEIKKLTLQGNDALNSLSLTQLSQINDELIINSCNSLSIIEFISVVKVRKVSIYENSNLKEVRFPILNDCFIWQLNDNLLLETCVIPALKTLGRFAFVRNSSLTNLGGSNIEHLSYLYLENNQKLQVINFNNLISVINIDIINNNSVTNIDFNSLLECTEQFNLTNCDLITSFSLPSASKLGGITILSNKKLSEIFLSQLIECADIYLNENIDLIVLDINSLKSITGNQFSAGAILCVNNLKMSSLKMDNLRSINSGVLSLTNNSISSIQVNYVLKIMNSIRPFVNNYRKFLTDQNPLAPPTGQGLNDKESLIFNGNGVYTD